MVTLKAGAEIIRSFGARLHQQVSAHGWQPNAPYSTNISWQGPPFSVNEYIAWLDKFSRRVESVPPKEITPELQIILDNLPEKYKALETTIANMASDHAAPFQSISMIMRWIEDELPPNSPTVDWEDIKGTDLVPQDLLRRLKSIDSRLKALEPQTGDLRDKITAINDAHDAALALPTDLQELRDAKTEIDGAASETKKIEGQASAHLTEVASLLEKIRRQDIEAIAIIEKCNQAFGIATTVGLAGSFTSRARWITVAAWVWVAGLIAALGAGFWIGKSRFEQLQDIIGNAGNPTVIWVNAAMALLGIGAPVWFAWIATKQIGQNFRLAEDYGFKATFARAYEGYRSEAATLSEDFAARLFESALDRLDEAPIRLVDPTIHGSPLQEFLHHPTIRAALSTAPELKNDITTFIRSKLGAAAVGAISATAITNASSDSPNSNQ